jgi:hypothetical protein
MEFKRLKEISVGDESAIESQPEPEKKKRGRQPNAPKKSESSEAIAGALVSIHGLLAGITKIPELELTEPEGKAISKALEDVANAYDFAPSPQTQAIIGLAVTVTSVYGMRIYAYKLRLAEEKSELEARAKQLEETEQATSNIYPLPTGLQSHALI